MLKFQFSPIFFYQCRSRCIGGPVVSPLRDFTVFILQPPRQHLNGHLSKCQPWPKLLKTSEIFQNVGEPYCYFFENVSKMPKDKKQWPDLKEHYQIVFKKVSNLFRKLLNELYFCLNCHFLSACRNPIIT